MNAEVTSKGFIVFTVLVIAFSLVSLLEPRSEIDSPEVLRMAPKSFGIHLMGEARDFPVERMTQTESWKELQNTASTYAHQLELIYKQNTQRSFWIQGLYLISAVGLGIFAILHKKNNPD